MDHRSDDDPDLQSATGPEESPPTLGVPTQPPAPLPTRRVARPEVPAVPPQPVSGIATTSEGIATEEGSPIRLGEIPIAAPGERDTTGEETQGFKGNVRVLGLVSFFTSAASEMVVPVRMLFLVAVLQTPLALAGLIEGLAESASSLLRILPGRLEQGPRMRKPLLLLGYGLSSVARPLLALAGFWQVALGLLLLDRAGRGIRSLPRDAVLASTAVPGDRGRVFGFHRGMDGMGALVGPLLAFVVLLLTYDDLRRVLAWTAVPGVLAVLVLALFFRERRPSPLADTTPAPALMLTASTLGKRFWLFTTISVVFAFGSSSEAFIFLRTADLADSVLIVPLVYFGFNLVYALLASPMSALSVRFGRLPVLVMGYAVFALVYLGWAVSVESWNAWVLFLVFGVYAAATEGLGRAFVTDIVAPDARSAALAWFGGLVGLTALPANVIAGWLWSAIGPSATFTFGFWAGVVAVALTLAWLPWLRSGTAPEEAFAGTDDTRLFALDMDAIANSPHARDRQVQAPRQ